MILYVCSQGRLRSRTAEVLTLLGGEAARSCGIDSDALVTINPRLVFEAHVIVCMQQVHADAVQEFPESVGKQIEVMGLPDVFNPFDDHFSNLIIPNLKLVGLYEYAKAIEKGRLNPLVQNFKRDF